MTEERYAKLLSLFRQSTDRLFAQLGRAIIGQREVLTQLLAAVFARGHVLLVGVPGLGKTMMVRCLAQTLKLSFKRIQFTPDLMPSDITGTNVIDEMDGRREFRFVQGPLFAHIILADEINRTPPKTQAALLEAMQERQVTVGQNTYPLPDPFFVIATQNPIEMEGTYPLPEAQLDRFMFNIYIDYPAEAEEERILSETTKAGPPELDQVLSATDIQHIQKLVWSVVASRYVIRYASAVVRATRPHSPAAPDFVRALVEWGAGPRAGQYLILGAKALAALDGRYNVSVSDIQRVAIPVLRHRISTNFQAQAEGKDSVWLVKELLATIPEPVVEKFAPAASPQGASGSLGTRIGAESQGRSSAAAAGGSTPEETESP
jgi:MoxR-like ATPase